MKVRFYLAKGAVLVLLGLMKLVPHGLCLSMGRCLGGLLFKLMKSRAQVALDNLEMIYGRQLNLQQRYALASNNFRHLGAGALELLYLAAKPHRLDHLVHMEGGQHLTRALAQGKGVVLFSGHLGNFYVLAAALGRYHNVKFLYRRPSQPWVANLYDWLLGRLGLQTIADNPRHLCAYHAYAHLRKQGVLGVLIDQVETGGLVVDFMGQPAGSSLGAGNMVLKSHAALVPSYCYREAKGTLKVVLEPAMEVPAEGSYDSRLEAIVRSTNERVGQWVGRYREQWFWGHRRWRKWRK